MAVSFGKVPKPQVLVRHLPYSSNWIGYSDKEIVIEGVVWHRMVGTLWGTDGHFFGGNAATAYGVGVVSIDGADDAGKIIEWLDPLNGHYYCHSSGPAKAPWGDGKLFVDRFGVARVNPQTVAIEISGLYTTKLDDPARRAIIDITAWLADRRHIPWQTFPTVPDQARSFVLWHQEFTGPAEKVCPGSVVMNETNELIEQVRLKLKRYQESSATELADKKPIPNPGTTQVYGGKSFAAYEGSVTLRKNFAPRQYATLTAAPTSKPYAKGRKVSMVNTTVGNDNELWFVEENGNRWPFKDIWEETRPT